ncbi:MAG TPA: hypothetical protein VHQ23_15110 [Ilumatobacteraceae bacterium]|nr:hypothetical protein [Ilumatobacteraceae bacterium]
MRRAVLCDAGGVERPRRKISAQDHFQGAPTEEINATIVATAAAARTEVWVMFFIAPSISLALRR